MTSTKWIKHTESFDRETNRYHGSSRVFCQVGAAGQLLSFGGTTSAGVVFDNMYITRKGLLSGSVV